MSGSKRQNLSQYDKNNFDGSRCDKFIVWIEYEKSSFLYTRDNVGLFGTPKTQPSTLFPSTPTPPSLFTNHGPQYPVKICWFDDINNNFIDVLTKEELILSRIIKTEKLTTSRIVQSTKEQDEMEARIFQRIIDMFDGVGEVKNYLKE